MRVAASRFRSSDQPLLILFETTDIAVSKFTRRIVDFPEETGLYEGCLSLSLPCWGATLWWSGTGATRSRISHIAPDSSMGRCGSMIAETSDFTVFARARQADLRSAVKHEVIVCPSVGTFPLMLFEISLVFAVKEATVEDRRREH